MQFLLDNSHFPDIDSAESGCFMITNGLGGYSCLDLAGGTARNDHAIFMAAVKAPNVRYNMITNLLIDIKIDGTPYSLNTQRMADSTITTGLEQLESIIYEDNMFNMLFHIEDVRLQLGIVMVHGENTLMLNYHLFNPRCRNIELTLSPLLRFTPKNSALAAGTEFELHNYDKLNMHGIFSSEHDDCQMFTADNCNFFTIEGNQKKVLCVTNMDILPLKKAENYSMKWTLDTRDGRDDTGFCVINHRLVSHISSPEAENIVIYSMNNPKDLSDRLKDGLCNAFLQAAAKEKQRIRSLIKFSGLKTELGRQLAASADAYIVERESTGGRTIIAGYPFFEDWGRDTMIALGGTTLAAGRFSDCKSILRTFAKYEKNGLLPNLFPEGGANPMYNSADAPLLFINAVYEYISFSGDTAFLSECFKPMKNIMDAYENGTDFHIRCDSDGLIMAGDGLEQLTWMDVRVDGFLPTPRHGKPVEINAYWYSSLRAMESFCRSLAASDGPDYIRLADKYAAMAENTKASFLAKFYNEKAGCLKDVLNGTYEENQIRCNQIWALTMPFTMPDPELSEKILDTVEKKLYTAIGLRTLDMDDPAFSPVYIGDMQKRDRAYHQGTVWTFPLGAYLRGRIHQLRFYDEKKRSVQMHKLERAFNALKDWLFEGCLGQFAEIYDGKCPTVSRGCFAQAWSVGEILRAVYEWENSEFLHQ